MARLKDTPLLDVFFSLAVLKMAEAELQKAKEIQEQHWFDKIPLNIKIIGIVAIGFLIYLTKLKGGNFGTVIFWGGLIFLMWYLFGKGKAKESGKITPRQARLLLEDELKYMIKKGELPQFTTFEVGHKMSIQYSNAMPQYYFTAIRIFYNDGKIEYNQGIVDMFEGLPVIQEAVQEVTGREAVPKLDIESEFMKHAKKYGFKDWLK